MGIKLILIYLEFLSNMKVYRINGKSGEKIIPDDVSPTDVPKFEESDQLLESTDDTGKYSSSVSGRDDHYLISIKKNSNVLHTIILDSGEGKKPELISSFWKESDEYDDDHFLGSFLRFFGLFMFEGTFVQVIYSARTSTEIVSAFDFNHDSVKAAPDGQFRKDLEFYCDSDSESQTVIKNLILKGQMCCQNGEEENFSMTSLKFFTDVSGEYLYFWILSVKYCEETQEFKPEHLNISFRTGFGIVPQDFELTFVNHYFRLHFAIVIDGNTYPVSFHLDSFRNASFEHQQDTFIQSVFSDDGCSYYCGEDTSRYDHIQRIARLEIEIQGFVPPEEDSDLEKSLKTLPCPTAKFLQRLIWRQLPQ